MSVRGEVDGSFAKGDTWIVRLAPPRLCHAVCSGEVLCLVDKLALGPTAHPKSLSHSLLIKNVPRQAYPPRIPYEGVYTARQHERLAARCSGLDRGLN